MEENLIFRKDVRISGSVESPSGGGAHDPAILINEHISQMNNRNLADYALDLTFDTFDGRDKSAEIDWYIIDFQEELGCNCIEMSMGFYYLDGGWWSSLGVEIPDDARGWRCVDNLSITPLPEFQEPPEDHRPFQTFVMRFEKVSTSKIRIIGKAGGSARFTSLARLAVYDRDFSRWSPLDIPRAKEPYYFQLISPGLVWDLSVNFMKLTGLTVTVPLMEYYLDNERYPEFKEKIFNTYAYQEKSNLMQMIGDTFGWNRNVFEWMPVEHPRKPYIQYSSINACATAGAPIIVDDEIVSTISTNPAVIIRDEFDEAWHANFCKDHHIDPKVYQEALANSIWMTREQLEGAANLLGLIANSIAMLARRNMYLEHHNGKAVKVKMNMKDLMKAAIAYMEEHLEDAISAADVAAEIALSPSYFSRCFTETVGCSPSEMLIQLRIDRAKQYFIEPGTSVMDVCVMFGYSPSYFSRLFKQKTGYSPREYIRQHQVNSNSR